MTTKQSHIVKELAFESELHAIDGLSVSGRLRAIETMEYPVPVRIGKRRKAYVISEVREWVAKRMAARAKGKSVAKPDEATDREIEEILAAWGSADPKTRQLIRAVLNVTPALDQADASARP